MRCLPALSLVLFTSIRVASAQVPSQLSGRLLFKLAGNDAGSESYRVERAADGGYRLSGDVELLIPNLRIVQHVEIEANARLAFQSAQVRAVVNEDSSEVTLRRDGSTAHQVTTQGGTTASADVETPESSVFLANNVIHHLIQFAWIHDGEVGESREFLAFPRVPITVKLEESSTLTDASGSLDVRRYFLNVANRLGVYVWLSGDGVPLKVLVPLQAFEAVDEARREWADRLSLESTQPDADEADLPYESVEVTFESDGIALAGTLTLPSGDGPWAAAVLITGSGAQDRDENTPGPGGLKLGIFRTIADSLTRRGIAVLRYDDRGVGGSGGSLSTAGLSDLVADVQAAVRYVRGRDEVDAARVALIGHSEGGIIAPIVAAEDAEIAAIVLMAGTSTPLDSVLVEQFTSAAREAGGDSAAVAEARAAAVELSRVIHEGLNLEEADLPPAYEALAGNRKWLREHFEHDPLEAIRRVRCPVLILSGGQDVQVAPRHARRLGTALDDAGHADHEVKIFPDLNHLFAVSKGEGTAEYSDPNAEVDPRFLSFMADWLTGRLANRRS